MTPQPAFTRGTRYTRRDISSTLGGSQVYFLPRVDNRIVCACLNKDCNPEAPHVILPGTGRVIESCAKLFCDQKSAIPVFIKQRTNEWEFIGYYKVERYSTDRAEIDKRRKGSVTKNITRVIFLKAVPEPKLMTMHHETATTEDILGNSVKYAPPIVVHGTVATPLDLPPKVSHIMFGPVRSWRKRKRRRH